MIRTSAKWLFPANQGAVVDIAPSLALVWAKKGNQFGIHNIAEEFPSSRCLEEVQREGEDRERERLRLVNEATKYSDILSQKEILVLGAEFELMDKNWD